MNNKVILPNRRKIKYNNFEYIDLGEENGMYKLYNTTTKMMEKVPKQQYINLNLQGFNSRVNLNGTDYDFD